jgi:hypothetical protein
MRYLGFTASDDMTFLQRSLRPGRRCPICSAAISGGRTACYETNIPLHTWRPRRDGGGAQSGTMLTNAQRRWEKFRAPPITIEKALT